MKTGMGVIHFLVSPAEKCRDPEAFFVCLFVCFVLKKKTDTAVESRLAKKLVTIAENAVAHSALKYTC